MEGRLQAAVRLGDRIPASRSVRQRKHNPSISQYSLSSASVAVAGVVSSSWPLPVRPWQGRCAYSERGVSIASKGIGTDETPLSLNLLT